MKPEIKIGILRIVCWLVVVIIPTTTICWFADFWNVGIIAVALPFILIAERVFRGLLRKCQLFDVPTRVEPCAAPNGGPATRVGKSNVTEGPPSVS
jgi:hypothetical protein